MASTINTNIPSLNAQRSLANTQNSLAVSMARLSSGLRVNSAKDDAAGLSIAERMTSQVRGMNVAMRNANDGISMSQTAEGALGKTGEILQRMRELAVQSANATNSTSDKSSLDSEFGELAKEVQRVFASTTFNGRKIMGSDAGAQIFQVGANTSAENQITVTTTNMTAQDDLKAVAGADIAGSNRAVITGSSVEVLAVIDKIDTAISKVSDERSVLAASQSRFESAISYLQISTENQAAARSRIMDADFAQETANLSRSQILSQAGSAMLAQANQLPQSVLALLRG
ncbi:flagellin [Limnohabitans sp. DM1]|uniref:flagellin N-terminal helical domain-containing protein n=1 Tax=Limnohabitans sp. DM1 TaxID=1597955 RepID=UPI000AEC928F|nr:flagellin [Limnohabitans sp. DM1]